MRYLKARRKDPFGKPKSSKQSHALCIFRSMMYYRLREYSINKQTVVLKARRIHNPEDARSKRAVATTFCYSLSIRFPETRKKESTFSALYSTLALI